MCVVVERVCKCPFTDFSKQALTRALDECDTIAACGEQLLLCEFSRVDHELGYGAEGEAASWIVPSDRNKKFSNGNLPPVFGTSIDRPLCNHRNVLARS